MKRHKHQKRRTINTVHLTEFERQTLAYLLYVIRRCTTKDGDAIEIHIDDSFSESEFSALWSIGLRLMRQGRARR